MKVILFQAFQWETKNIIYSENYWNYKSESILLKNRRIHHLTDMNN